MSDPTRGITCPDMRRIVREALHEGWEWAGWTGSTHARIVWPATGDVLTFGCTPSLASWKSLATDVRRVSGVTVWRKGNRKRSRKAVRPSGFSIPTAKSECGRWHDDWDATVGQLQDTRADLIAQARKAAEHRATLRDIPPLLVQIADVERRLGTFNIPVVPFDPFTLRATS